MTTILHGGLFDGLEIQMPPQGQVLFMTQIPPHLKELDYPPWNEGLPRHVYIMDMDARWCFSHVQEPQ
jgi:hypothetical protein